MAHEHIVYSMLADAAAMAADEAGLRQYAPILEQLAGRDEHLPFLAVAHRAWGVAHRLAGEHDQAEARLQQASDLFQQMGAAWQVGRTQCELAELSLARSDRAAAIEHLHQALAAFEAQGAGPDIERTERLLAAIS